MAELGTVGATDVEIEKEDGISADNPLQSQFDRSMMELMNQGMSVSTMNEFVAQFTERVQ